jgi:hypothetical protein
MNYKFIVRIAFISSATGGMKLEMRADWRKATRPNTKLQNFLSLPLPVAMHMIKQKPSFRGLRYHILYIHHDD